MKQIRVSSIENILLIGVRTVGLPEDLYQNNHGNRLTGLALMSVHTKRPVNKEEILEDFVASQRRRSD